MSDQGDPNLNDQQFNIDSMNLLQGGNMNISTNVNISNIFKNQISNNQNTNIHNIHNPDSTNANNNQTNNNNNNNRQTNTYGNQACNLLDSFIPYPQNKNNEDQLNNVDITQSVIPQNYVNEKNQFSSNQENIQNNQNNNNNNNINNNNSNLNNNISNQSNNIPEYRDFFNNFENNNNINNNQPVKKNSNSINQNANINNHNSNATNFDLESKQSARHFLNNFNSMAQQSNVSNFSMGNFELKNQFSVNQRGKVYQNQNFSNNLSVQNSYFGGENSEYRQPQMDYNFNSDLNNMRSRPLFQNEKSTNFNGNFNQINNNNNNNNNLQQSNFATAGFSTILEGHKKMENMEISYPIQDSVFGHPHNIQNSMIISEQFQIQGSKIGASIFQTSEQNRIDQAYQQQNNFQQQQPQIFDSFMQPANHEQFRNKTDPNIDGSSDDDDDEDDEQQCENGNNTYIGIQMQSFSNEPFTQTNRYKTQTRYTQRVSNPNNKIYAKKSQKQDQGEQYQQQQQQQHQQQYEQQVVTKEEQKYNYQGQQYNMFNDQNNQNPDNQYQQQNQYQNNNDNNNNYNVQNLDKDQDLSNQIQEMPNLSEQEYNWPYASNNSQKRQALAKNESKNKLKKQKLKDKQQKKAKLEEFSSNNEASNQNNMFSNNNNINKNLDEIGEDSSGSLSEEGKKKVALYTTVKTTQKTEIKTRNKDHKKKYRQSRHKNVFKNFGSALMRFIQYNQYFIEKKRSIFSDPELFPPINYEKLNLPIQSKHNEINQHIKNFDNWLKNQIRLERKTDFVQGWTWYESDSDEVCKFKDALRLLCYEFFENFALNYLMNSKKLDDLEIHLKSIFPFIAGINDPQTLERFKPK